MTRRIRASSRDAATPPSWGLLTWSSLWVHLVADLLGGAVAGLAFKTLSLDGK